MSTYLGFTAAALLMLALALAFVVPALWPAAASRRLAWALLLVLPVASTGLYALLGAPAILQAQARGIAPAAHDVDTMVAALEARLNRDRRDAEGWYVLGRSYLDLEKYAEALAALAEAKSQAPDKAAYLAAYAEALAMTRGNDLAGEPGRWIAQALRLDPLEPKALELAGLAAYQAKDFAAASRYWRQLLARLPRQSEMYEDIAAAISRAQTQAR